MIDLTKFKFGSGEKIDRGFRDMIPVMPHPINDVDITEVIKREKGRHKKIKLPVVKFPFGGSLGMAERTTQRKQI